MPGENATFAAGICVSSSPKRKCNICWMCASVCVCKPVRVWLRWCAPHVCVGVHFQLPVWKSKENCTENARKAIKNVRKSAWKRNAKHTHKCNRLYLHISLSLSRGINQYGCVRVCVCGGERRRQRERARGCYTNRIKFFCLPSLSGGGYWCPWKTINLVEFLTLFQCNFECQRH